MERVQTLVSTPGSTLRSPTTGSPSPRNTSRDRIAPALSPVQKVLTRPRRESMAAPCSSPRTPPPSATPTVRSPSVTRRLIETAPVVPTTTLKPHSISHGPSFTMALTTIPSGPSATAPYSVVRHEALEQVHTGLSRRLQAVEDSLVRKLTEAMEIVTIRLDSGELRISRLEKRGTEHQQAIDDLACMPGLFREELERKRVNFCDQDEGSSSTDMGGAEHMREAFEKDRSELMEKMAEISRQMDDWEADQNRALHGLQEEFATSEKRLSNRISDLDQAHRAMRTCLNDDVDTLAKKLRDVEAKNNAEAEKHSHLESVLQELDHQVQLSGVQQRREVDSALASCRVLEQQVASALPELEQKWQDLGLRITDFCTEQSSARLRDVSESQIRLDAFKMENDKVSTGLEKLTKTVREMQGKQHKERRRDETQSDVEELRRVVHDIAETSRLQGEKMGELEREVMHERETRKRYDGLGCSSRSHRKSIDNVCITGPAEAQLSKLSTRFSSRSPASPRDSNQRSSGMESIGYMPWTPLSTLDIELQNPSTPRTGPKLALPAYLSDRSADAELSCTFSEQRQLQTV